MQRLTTGALLSVDREGRSLSYRNNKERTLRRVRQTAALFNLDWLDEMTWLLDAERQKTERRRSNSLTGVLTTVKTMVKLRSDLARQLDRPMSTWRLMKYAADLRASGALIPETQAVPVPMSWMQQLGTALPWHLFALFLFAFRTASRIGECVQLTGHNLVLGPEDSYEALIMWLQTTKAAASGHRPYAVHNITHLRLDPTNAWDRKLWDLLRGLRRQDHLSPFRSYEEARLVLQYGIPPSMRILQVTGHSFRNGGEALIERLMADPALQRKVRPWVPDVVMKHASAMASAEFSDLRIQYATKQDTSVLLQLGRNTTMGELTLRMVLHEA